MGLIDYMGSHSFYSIFPQIGESIMEFPKKVYK